MSTTISQMAARLLQATGGKQAISEQEACQLIGQAMALQQFKLQHADTLTTAEACALLGCKRSTLYKKNLPHNSYGWSKRGILDELNK